VQSHFFYVSCIYLGSLRLPRHQFVLHARIPDLPFPGERYTSLLPVTAYLTFPLSLLIIEGSFATCLLNIHDLGRVSSFFTILIRKCSYTWCASFCTHSMILRSDFGIRFLLDQTHFLQGKLSKDFRSFSALPIVGRTFFATSRRVWYKRVLYLFTVPANDLGFIGVPLD